MKKLHTKRPEVLVGSAVGEDCGAIALEPDEVLVISTDPITGTASDIGALAVVVTANDLASAGAEPVGIMLTILLPPGTEEGDLARIMSDVDQVCTRHNIQVIGGHTEVTEVVNRPVLSVTGVGKVKRDKMISTGGAKPGMDLVLSKWIGLEGTSLIAKDKEQDLLQRFSPEFVEKAKGFDQYLSVVADGRIGALNGAAAMHDVTEGGILGALWEMGEASDVGLSVDLARIPVFQETIEICEYYDINPYGLISSGAMLFAVPGGDRLVSALEEAGIHGTVIGHVTEGRDRVLRHHDGEVRFIEPPASDEFHKVLKGDFS